MSTRVGYTQSIQYVSNRRESVCVWEERTDLSLFLGESCSVVICAVLDDGGNLEKSWLPVAVVVALVVVFGVEVVTVAHNL